MLLLLDSAFVSYCTLLAKGTAHVHMRLFHVEMKVRIHCKYGRVILALVSLFQFVYDSC